MTIQGTKIKRYVNFFQAAENNPSIQLPKYINNM